MSVDPGVSREEAEALRDRLHRDAESGGYHLNPDTGFALSLVEGLLANERRFGYRSCPCRLASGDREDDLDIVCPCDYRDADLDEWGACYCALYVSDAVLRGERAVRSIPERRPPAEERVALPSGRTAPDAGAGTRLPVWRCRVCGYLCARDEPPEVCPICKASRDRFERFW
jgi:ferredoxin-thioredoxin reductase catalytic subunit